MLTNDILRRVRYALDLNDAKVTEIFALDGVSVQSAQLETMFKKEDESGFVRCPDSLAHGFFRGLIVFKRGRREGQDGSVKAPPGEMTNNDALWYLRIAMQLKDDDVMAILKKVGVNVGKAELNALFRKKGGENFRPCGDQFLRNFLAGFSATYRP
jgi:uncharacterized protein YehS (DUF1456 family)